MVSAVMMSVLMLMPGPMQLALVVVIVLLLFGASRLGDIGKGLGEGIRNFKKGIRDDEDEGPEVASADEKSS